MVLIGFAYDVFCLLLFALLLSINIYYLIEHALVVSRSIVWKRNPLKMIYHLGISKNDGTPKMDGL